MYTQGIKTLRATTDSGVDSTTSNPVAPPPNTSETPAANEAEFDTFLRSVLRSEQAGMANEEELFAGIVHERIKKSKGDEIAAQYQSAFDSEVSLLSSAGGFASMEDVAKGALRSLRDTGTLTKEEADKIYSESFAAAQLDSNTEALYDGRGGADDPTRALAELATALETARLKIDAFDGGASVATIRSLDEASNSKYGAMSGGFSDMSYSDGTGYTDTMGIPTGDVSQVAPINEPQGELFDGQGNFLFKPESSTDGNLAVLLPEALAHQVLSLIIKDQDGNTIEQGRSTGYGDFGVQEKFAFTRPGGTYGQGVSVQALLSDGTTREWRIPDSSKRYD
jgi:hypothetical protein